MSTAYDKLLGRVELALETASSNGMLPGEDYKMWVIDQMVRALTGCDEEETEPGVFPKHDSADYLEFRASARGDASEWATGKVPHWVLQQPDRQER